MIFQVGDIFSAEFQVTPEIHEQFILLSQDRNPLHTDTAFAQSKGFQGKVMHGNILNAFLSYFIGECLPTQDVIIHSQDIQYKKAVHLNDNLQLEAKVAGIYESVQAVEFKYKFIRTEGETVARGKFQIGLLP